MSKRTTIESRIITYFESAPIQSVEIVLGIVREKVKARQRDLQPPTTRVHKTKRQARATNAKPATDTAATTTIGAA